MNAVQMKRQFLEYTEIERGRAVKTIQNYDHYLDRFFSQMNIVEISDISEEKVREFRLWLNRQSGTGKESMKRKTQNYYLIALRSFLKFLRKRGMEGLSPEKIELAKVPERHLDLITSAELERLMAAPMEAYEKEKNEPKNDEKKISFLRDNAILQLLFSTGLRVSELCSLNNDLDLTRDEFSVRGKGEKVRVVFLSEESKEAVKAYLKARKDLLDALFIDGTEKKPHRITPRDIQRHIKKYAAIAGITSKVTPHTMRHVFATDLLTNGADIRSVQQLLGHASINTTQIYTHITDAHLREVHKKFHAKK